MLPNPAPIQPSAVCEQWNKYMNGNIQLSSYRIFHITIRLPAILLMHQTAAASIAAQKQAAGCMDVKSMASLPKANQWFSNTICMAI